MLLWAICGGTSSISSDQGFLLKEQVKIYRRPDTAIFQMGKGDVCALTVQYTHIKPHTEANSISADTHKHTHRGGREVLVKWQARGTEWGGARGGVTRGQGHAVSCVCIKASDALVCVCMCVCVVHVLGIDTSTLRCGRQPPSACK